MFHDLNFKHKKYIYLQIITNLFNIERFHKINGYKINSQYFKFTFRWLKSTELIASLFLIM